MIDSSFNMSVRPERSRGALAQTLQGRPSTSLGTNEVKRAELKKAAEAFEAVFMRQMIGSMRQANLGEDLLGSRATDQFRDMQDAQLADSMAKTGSFGIAELLLAQFGGPESKAPGPEDKK
jgi:flagellar protein FlgJ